MEMRAHELPNNFSGKDIAETVQKAAAAQGFWVRRTTEENPFTHDVEHYRITAHQQPTWWKRLLNPTDKVVFHVPASGLTNIFDTYNTFDFKASGGFGEQKLTRLLAAINKEFERTPRYRHAGYDSPYGEPQAVILVGGTD